MQMEFPVLIRSMIVSQLVLYSKQNADRLSSRHAFLLAPVG